MNPVGLIWRAVELAIARPPPIDTIERQEVVHVDGVDVAVELGTTRGRDESLDPPSWSYAVHARLAARMPGCRRLSAWIAPGSYFVAFGRQDERLGHAGFDDRYLVKCADVELLRFWLPPPSLEAMLATYDAAIVEPFALALGEQTAVLRSRTGYEAKPVAPPRVEAAIAATARLGGRARELAEGWRARGDALGLVPTADLFDVDGGYALRSETRRVPLELTFPDQLLGLRRRGLRTVLRAPRTAPSAQVGALWRPALPRANRPSGAKLRGDALAVAGLHGHDRGGPWLAATLAPRAAQLGAAAPDALAITETVVELRWEAYVDDATRLAAALDLVELLAAPPPAATGPYR